MSGLMDLVFPPKCGGCDRPGTLLCDRCREALPLIDQARACSRCGAPLVGPSRALPGLAPPQEAFAARDCAECCGREFAFGAARCAALLAPPISRAVVMLKDGGERRYAAVLAAILAEAAAGWLSPDDVLVPAPASPAAVRRRGFDHAADVTRALGGITGHRTARLLRATTGADQRNLGRSERFANRQGAFRLASGRAGAHPPDRVVMVDDVFTTGATFEAAARLLREAGVAEVRALAVARSVRSDSRHTPA